MFFQLLPYSHFENQTTDSQPFFLFNWLATNKSISLYQVQSSPSPAVSMLFLFRTTEACCETENILLAKVFVAEKCYF